jgi:isoaspartyl peptidase/L-asparaginase-like protein (Ntn-hydrolase superfamily)
MPPYFIAVHAGAGYHGPNKEEAYTAAMRRALRAAAAALDQGCSSMDAVKIAICALEVCHCSCNQCTAVQFSQRWKMRYVPARIML